MVQQIGQIMKDGAAMKENKVQGIPNKTPFNAKMASDRTKDAVISYFGLTKEEQAQFRLLVGLSETHHPPSFLDIVLNEGTGVYKP